MANTSIEKDSVSFNEEIKKIRTNIKFSSVNEDVKVILFNKNKDYKGLKTTSWNKVYKMIMEDLC